MNSLVETFAIPVFFQDAKVVIYRVISKCLMA